MKYTFEEIMSEHEYAQANEMAGYLLHGGLDSEGNYIQFKFLNMAITQILIRPNTY